MINLKEAFRYQKYLDGLLTESIIEMSRDQHMFRTTENHLYNDANPDKENVVREQEVDDYVGNDVMVDFVEFIIRNKELLTEAINKAKHSMDFDMDALVTSNKMRREAVSYMKTVLTKKPSTYTQTGSDWKFNGEGNQTKYYYTIEITKEDSFDRKRFRNAINKLNREAELISTKVDAGLVNTLVDYDPPFDVDEELDQVLLSFVDSFKGEANE